MENKRDILYFEQKVAKGLEHLQPLIHAIQRQLQISLVYTKYGDNSSQKKL